MCSTSGRARGRTRPGRSRLRRRPLTMGGHQILREEPLITYRCESSWPGSQCFSHKSCHAAVGPCACCSCCNCALEVFSLSRAGAFGIRDRWRAPNQEDGNLNPDAAHGQVLVRCRPQLPHETTAVASGLRTPKPFTPRATLPRPRSRNALEGSGGSGGGVGCARSSFEGATQPPTLTVHDAAGVLTTGQCTLQSTSFALSTPLKMSLSPRGRRVALQASQNCIGHAVPLTVPQYHRLG